MPAILGDAIGMRSIAIASTTVRDAIAELRQHPKLGPLIFEEGGKLRPHVLVFFNETDTRHLTTLDVPLTDQDRLAIVQAVSGG